MGLAASTNGGWKPHKWELKPNKYGNFTSSNKCTCTKRFDVACTSAVAWRMLLQCAHFAKFVWVFYTFECRWWCSAKSRKSLKPSMQRISRQSLSRCFSSWRSVWWVLIFKWVCPAICLNVLQLPLSKHIAVFEAVCVCVPELMKYSKMNTLIPLCKASQCTLSHFSMSACFPPYLHVATSEMWCWSGSRELIELSLCYSVVCHYNGAQRYETSSSYRLVDWIRLQSCLV